MVILFIQIFVKLFQLINLNFQDLRSNGFLITQIEEEGSIKASSKPLIEEVIPDLEDDPDNSSILELSSIKLVENSSQPVDKPGPARTHDTFESLD